MSFMTFQNVVDLTDDEILREIDCNEVNSIEKILDRWRKSVSRQEDSFSRRGDSERNKGQISQNSRELKDAASKTQKITSFYSSTSSVHSSNRSNVEVIEETMDDIMRDLVSIGDAEEDGDVNDTEDLVAALNRIEEDANFSIPFSQKADQKQQGMSKFEFLQRISIKSFLNYRVKLHF